MGEQMFSMESEVVGLPSVLCVDQKICEKRRFTISEVSCESP
jgi:hypothetical protein